MHWVEAKQIEDHPEIGGFIDVLDVPVSDEDTAEEQAQIDAAKVAIKSLIDVLRPTDGSKISYGIQLAGQAYPGHNRPEDPWRPGSVTLTVYQIWPAPTEAEQE